MNEARGAYHVCIRPGKAKRPEECGTNSSSRFAFRQFPSVLDSEETLHIINDDRQSAAGQEPLSTPHKALQAMSSPFLVVGANSNANNSAWIIDISTNSLH